MRLHFIILGLFAGLEVLALNIVAPWEMMYFYAAYKAKWLSGLNGSQRQIATLCRRSTAHPFPASDFDTQAAEDGVTAMCSFDDFFKFVGTTETFRDYIYTLEGNMWAIDEYWKDISTKFSGITGVNVAFDFEKLLRKAGFVGTVLAYPPTIMDIANTLQTAREAAPDKAAVTSQVGNAMEYARITQQLRDRDGATRSCQDASKYICLSAPNPFSIQTKAQVLITPPAPYTGVSIVTFNNNEIDFDITLTSNSANGAQRNAFKRYYETEYSNEADTETHNDVI